MLEDIFYSERNSEINFINANLYIKQPMQLQLLYIYIYTSMLTRSNEQVRDC